MSEITKTKSFRLPAEDIAWINNTSLKRGVTHTDIIKDCIKQYKISESGLIVKDIQSEMYQEVDNETFETLKALGISTASGIAGYYLAGYIRKQLDYDEDKGTQILIGLMAGLGAMMFQLMKDSKK